MTTGAVRTAGSRCLTAVAVACFFAATPVSALEWTCPTNPGDCFADVGSDGCYDPGVDDADIRAQLLSTSYVPASGGSLVCPPSTAPLRIPDGTTWQVPGSILLHGVRLEDPTSAPFPDVDTIVLAAGDRLFVRGIVEGEERGAVHLRGRNGVELADRAAVRTGTGPPAGVGIDVASAEGNVVVGARARLSGRRVGIAAAHDVVLGAGVKIDFPSNAGALGAELVAGGDLRLGSPRIASTNARVHLAGVRVYADHLFLGIKRGVLTAIESAPDGVIALGSLQMVEGILELTGGAVEIGRIDPRSGKPARSVVTGRTTIDVQGDVTIRGVQFRGPSFPATTVDLSTSADTVILTGNGVQGRKGAPPVLRVAAGPGSVCDLTGTKLGSGGTVTTDCGSVVGP